jgi:hypothetical protein
MATNFTGNCYLCGAKVGNTTVKKHLLKHYAEEQYEEGRSGQECYLLKAEGAFRKGYWLYIDVPVEKTLVALDSFLRKIWLECCGHMSAFFLPGRVELTIGRKLKTLDVGTKLSHEYDFGTTTETVITIVESVKRKPQKEAFRLLARNAPPVFKCVCCGKPAEYICTECSYESDNPFYCAECAREDEHGEEMMLPVTNSPRMGECGYTGDLDTFAFDPASVASGKESRQTHE